LNLVTLSFSKVVVGLRPKQEIAKTEFLNKEIAESSEKRRLIKGRRNSQVWIWSLSLSARSLWGFVLTGGRERQRFWTGDRWELRERRRL